jgi:tRNA threonylcarbamoyladenosine biosynthesis protein TsaB
MLLAIDTATRQISLALHDGATLRAEFTWPSENQHTVQLMPGIQRLLSQADVRVGDLTAYAVTIGPGSFTGLRIGVAAAKGMAAASDAPLVGVNTLEVVIVAHPGTYSAALIAVVQAGRGRVIARSYHWQKGEWTPRTEMRIFDWVSLINAIDGAAIITGEIDITGLKFLKDAQAAGTPVTIAPGGLRMRRAGILAELAWSQLRAADSADGFAPALVTPIYVKSDGVV